MSETTLDAAQRVADKSPRHYAASMARHFWCRAFVKGEEVFFNEVSPRPHDTGLVTLISQDLSEFAYMCALFSSYPFQISLNMVRAPRR